MRLLHLSLIIALSAGLCACGGSGDKHYDSKRVTVVEETARVPKNAKVKIGKPYKIQGKKYTPKYRTAYSQEGMASWYGPGFQGKKTANGERFDTHKLTAAHQTLQLPSFVKVTNLENGKSVNVRVNDRGPFAKDRIIDLSMAAAQRLGFKHKGVAHVRVDLIQSIDAGEQKIAVASASPNTLNNQSIQVASMTPLPVESIDISSGTFIQMGAFRVESNAKALARSLGQNVGVSSGGEFYRVYVGPFSDMKQAVEARDALRSNGYKTGRITSSI